MGSTVALAVVIGFLLVGVLLTSGARNLWLDTNYRTFFSDDNPQLNAFESLQDIYKP
jgi:predicted RND superfamily exporter protein